MGTTEYCIFLVTGCLVTGLRDVKVAVPRAARKGDSVVLHCHYDLQADPLYSLKWYKGRAEFYRYTPTDTPPIKLFLVPGLAELHVDMSKSNDTQLFLRSVSPSLSGQYNCEVSTDAPSFHTAIATAYMDVVEVPVQPPVLSGVKSRYRVRETMRAKCTAAPSRPAVNLTWGINGENVNPRLVTQYRQVPELYPDRQQSMSILEVPLRAQHFTAEGRMRVRCTASLYDLYWQTTERVVEQEGREDMVRDNQVPGGGGGETWDEYDDDDDYVDAEEKLIIGVFPTATPGEGSQTSSHPRVEQGPLCAVGLYLLLASTLL